MGPKPFARDHSQKPPSAHIYHFFPPVPAGDQHTGAAAAMLTWQQQPRDSKDRAVPPQYFAQTL